ncbi:hypothetical protein Efla_007514 [Eimeria flavescens]
MFPIGQAWLFCTKQPVPRLVSMEVYRWSRLNATVGRLVSNSEIGSRGKGYEGSGGPAKQEDTCGNRRRSVANFRRRAFARECDSTSSSNFSAHVDWIGDDACCRAVDVM